jgi:GrpB-like predicted nucleotidyltransferase (UPF0157 family)
MWRVSEPAVELVEYDRTWPDRAAAAIAELKDVLSGVLAEIEHIGSTAVPGLAAKPIIDLMAAVTDLAVVERHEETLGDKGYRRHSNGMADRLLYVRTVADTRTHILHVVTRQSWPTRNQRIFRDYLRNHPREAGRYADLKRRIVASGIGPAGYSQAKTALIQELTDCARAELGLPSVPVWEKTER